MAASGNSYSGECGNSVFEPTGSSASKYTGKNLISPLADISAMTGLRDHASQPNAFNSVYKAIDAISASRVKSLTAGKLGDGTTEVGDLIFDAF